MPLFGAPGERIGYELYPHPDGAPPLLLIHGFTASKVSFEVNLEGLREHFTVITAELLGHGDSDAPADPVFYRPERAVRRILQLLDHLGYQRVLLCGHSLGGALALRIALEAQEWVAGLVVINSSSAAGDPEWRDAARPRMLEMAERLRDEGTGFMKSTRLYPAHSKRLDPLSRELLTRDFDRLNPAGLAGTAESLVVDVNVWERHPVLAVPMLLIVGERDADFAPNADAFMERFPPDLTRIVRLPHAGHAANIEQPGEFEAAVVEFGRDIGYLPLPVAPGESNRMLTALGGSLVVAGIGLLAAAIIFTGGNDKNDDGQQLAAAPNTTQVVPSQTALAGVAGTRVTGPALAVTPGANTTVTTPASSATSAPSATTVPATATSAAPTATKPAATQAPANTPEPTSTPAPTATATPAATATPSGPFAAISGPSIANVGETVVLYDASSPEPMTYQWTTPTGPQNAEAGVSFTPTVPGCYNVSLTVFFPNGQKLTTAKGISVGGVACQ